VTRKTLLTGALAALLAAGLLAWAFAPRPVEVEVAAVTEGPFESALAEEGRTRLRDRYVVSAAVAGRLARVGLQPGDAVRAGDVIAWLQPAFAPMLDDRSRRELESRAFTAQERVKLAQARVDQAELGLQQAASELRRTEPLAAQGFVSPTRLEDSRRAAASAASELESARQERRVSDAGLTEARAALVAVRSASVPGASPRDFAVRAPVAGRVLRVLQPSETVVGLGTPLFELGDTSRLEVVVELLTTDAPSISPGTPVRIERWGGPAELEGEVRRVEPGAFTKVSALGVEEQRVNVVVDIRSPPGQWASLGDGYRVRARLLLVQREHVPRVPTGALFPLPQGAGQGVFVVEGGRARLRPVDVGARGDVEAWVRQGVAAGATVVVYPPPAVADGVRVRVRQP
jgi:HlyD family secretion protein